MMGVSIRRERSLRDASALRSPCFHRITGLYNAFVRILVSSFPSHVGKHPLHLSCTNQMIEQAEVLALKPNPTCNDRRVNLQSVRQLNRGVCGAQFARCAIPPFVRRNERFSRHLVRRLLLRISLIAEVQVVDEGQCLATQVKAEMRKFVHETEPEIVQAIVPKCESYDRSSVLDNQCSAVDMSPR